MAVAMLLREGVLMQGIVHRVGMRAVPGASLSIAVLCLEHGHGRKREGLPDSCLDAFCRHGVYDLVPEGRRVFFMTQLLHVKAQGVIVIIVAIIRRSLGKKQAGSALQESSHQPCVLLLSRQI